MYRGADVCVCVKIIKPCDKSRQYIIARKLCGAESLAGRIYKINYNRDRVCKHDEAHHPLKCVYVEEKGINYRSREIHKPE